MRMLIRKMVVAFIFGAFLVLYPPSVAAADFSFNINILRQDGAACGELWLNNELVWRVAVLSDGARPVSGSYGGNNTTLIIPDIVNGMFVLKVE